MTTTDAQLLADAREGSAEAMEALLARHEKQVYRFGLRMCGDEEAAREVLQETLLTAFRSLRSFRGEASLSTWLYQIARSFCLRSRRRGSGHEPLEHAGQVPCDTPAADDRAHAGEVAELLQAALLALSTEQREAVVLRDVEGLSVEEAAGVVGLGVPAFKSRLHRARLTMRSHLSALLEGSNAPCPDLVRQLAGAVDEIDQAACLRIDEHLASCARCAGACDDLQRSVSLCRRLPGDAVPAPIRRAIRHALSEAVARPA